MPWATLIPLLIQFGPGAFDLAAKLIEKWNSPDLVTLSDINELRAMGQRTSKDALVQVLTRAGVPLTSEQAAALLRLA